jgi:putative glutamine amidotransferase
VPTAPRWHDVVLADYAQWLDGVVMHGGADVWPGSYGEEPLQPRMAR